MYEYSHGGNAIFEKGREHIIDLSANINPLGVPENLFEAITHEMPNINRYPDNFSTLLREKTAAYERVNPDWMMFTGGASEILFRLPRALSARKVMLCSPTFADYERSALSHGAKVISHVLRKEDGFSINYDFMKAVQSEKPDLIYICNPNNPTGIITEKTLIKELLECCKQIGARVVIDECFIDFVEQAEMHTSKPFLAGYNNLVIVKAFKKIFALAGIRLGYAMCSDEDVIRRLYFHGPDWAVSNIAQAAGVAALDNAERYIRETQEYVSKERTTMKMELKHLGYTTFESLANYIFFQSPFTFDLCKELDERGLRIRSCSNYYGLDGTYYRVAVSTKGNNTKFLKTIKEITKC